MDKQERISVNVVIDIGELEDIKRLTKVDANATAIVAAARIGREFLAKMNGMMSSSIVNEISNSSSETTKTSQEEMK